MRIIIVPLTFAFLVACGSTINNDSKGNQSTEGIDDLSLSPPRVCGVLNEHFKCRVGGISLLTQLAKLRATYDTDTATGNTFETKYVGINGMYQIELSLRDFNSDLQVLWRNGQILNARVFVGTNSYRIDEFKYIY